MAQVGIREYDAKKMFFESIGQTYNGIQIFSETDLEKLEDGKKYVIKPDMLFGKRGKLGLLGIKLSKSEVQDWFKKYNEKTETINGLEGTLDVFLVEEFIEHKEEYYISISAERKSDILNFSTQGGIEIEENWEQVKSIEIGLQDNFSESENWEKLSTDTIKNKDKVISTITNLWNFYKNYGFVYLEVNPFCFDSEGNIVLLDMVAKVDDQEHFRQKKHWKNLEIPNTFGFKESKREQYIKELDNQTGASLKFKILNPNAKIWTLLAGGGGSLVMTDSLGALGYADNIGNYGELSGNPTRDFTREYTRTLLEQMLENKQEGKYLIIAGAIANFTDIATTFSGIIDVFQEKQEEIRNQKVQILIRRGGINEKKGLKIIQTACEEMNIPCKIADSSEYMTDILREVKV